MPQTHVKVYFFHPSQYHQEKVFSFIKNGIPKEKNSAIVYSIPCPDCRSSYVGETWKKVGAGFSLYRKDILRRKIIIFLWPCTPQRYFNIAKIVGRKEDERKLFFLYLTPIIIMISTLCRMYRRAGTFLRDRKIERDCENKAKIGISENLGILPS